MLNDVGKISIYTNKGRPESTYALRIGGWGKPKAYSRVQGRWIGKDQSVCIMQSPQNETT